MPSAGQALQSPGKWARRSLEHSIGRGPQGKEKSLAEADTPGLEHTGSWAGASAWWWRGKSRLAKWELHMEPCTYPLSFHFAVASAPIYKPH